MQLRIKGKNINLRTLKKSDAVSIYNNVCDREIGRFIPNLPYPYKLKQAVDFIKETQKKSKKKEAYELGIEDKNTKKIIGMMSLNHIDKKNKNAELGYWLGKSFWGRGIAKEALSLILDFGFNRLNLVRIYARVLHPNVASYKLLEKAGFRLEGRLRKDCFHRRRWMDSFRYGLLSEEYFSKT